MEIKPLVDFGGRRAHLKRQWIKLWKQIGDRLLSLPDREQEIILEDILTAIQSRLYVFEHILKES